LVGKLCSAGGKSLVASGRQPDPVADLRQDGQRQPQCHLAFRLRIRLGDPALPLGYAIKKSQFPETEEAVAQAADTGNLDMAFIAHQRHDAFSAKLRLPQIDTAPAVPKRRITTPAVDAPLRLVQAMGKASKLGTKLTGIANDLADFLYLDQQVLRRHRPVDEENLHAGAVIGAALKVVLGDRIAGEATRNVAGCRRKTGLLLGRTCRKATGSGEAGIGEGEVVVMLGKTEDDAIPPHHSPGMAKCRRVAIEMHRQRWVDGSHGTISVSGIVGIRPALKADRLTSIRPVAKRTGTSNSKPAVMAAPAAGI